MMQVPRERSIIIIFYRSVALTRSLYVHSDSCTVSNLCTTTAFAENLKAELSNIA